MEKPREPVLEQPPPLQPVNVEPAAGVAVRVTAEPLANAAEQVAPQSMPVGDEVTVPVPVLLAPPITEAGENVKVFGMLAVTVNGPFTAVPLAVAEIFTVVLAVTGLVTTVKGAVELPAGTVTELGIEATAEPPLTIASETAVSTCAAAAMVTVPVVLSPPTTEAGLNLRVLGISGVMVSTLERVVPEYDAVIVAVLAVFAIPTPASAAESPCRPAARSRWEEPRPESCCWSEWPRFRHSALYPPDIPCRPKGWVPRRWWDSA